MRPGPKPEPIERRIAKGNPSKKKLPGVVLLAGRPDLDDLAEPPAHLDEDAKAFWRRDVVRLAEVGILDRVDVGALEALCVSYARAVQARRIVASEGLFTAGSVGQIREHPALKIEREAWAAFERAAEGFGIGPVARTRLGLAELGRRTLAADLQERIGMPDFQPLADVDIDEILEAEATPMPASPTPMTDP